MRRRQPQRTPQQAASSHHRLRIIAGEWRGRRLTFPTLPGLRPTPDRVRETLFNWLTPQLPGAHCLDLFAGSGLLGLEALSRGAASVLFVDQAAAAVAALRANLQQLACDRGEVRQLTAAQLLAAPPPRRFDLIFLDPPFSEQLLPLTLRQLAAGAWLQPGARIYIEQDQAGAVVLPAGWQWLRQRRAGQVAFALAAVDSSDGGDCLLS